MSKTGSASSPATRDATVKHRIERLTLGHPYNYFTTPLRSPPGYPNLPPSQRRYFYLDIRPAASQPVRATLLLLHGFPDSSFGWRKVVQPLRQAGFRLIVPDLLGYGRSSKPERLEEYGEQGMAYDLADLMTFAMTGQPQTHGMRFAVVGHDWGSWLAWKLALWIPDRLLGIHGICVAYVAPTSRFVSTTQMAQKFSQFSYQVFFEQPRSTAAIEGNLDLFLRLVYVAPSRLVGKVKPEDVLKVFGAGAESLERTMSAGIVQQDQAAFADAFVLTKEEEEVYTMFFSPHQGGSMDGLKWYRTRPINYEQERVLTSKTLPKLPYKMLCPTMDPTGPADLAEAARRYMPEGTPYTVEAVPNAGHWVMVEAAPQAINSIITWMDKDVLPFHASMLSRLTSSRL